jgi:RNA polymerase sigma-70 factor (ECF subfamily)
VQETFIRLFKISEKITSDFNIKSWLYRVAINICLDKKRYYKRVQNYIRTFIESKEPTKNVTLNKVILSDEVKKILEPLDPKIRMIFILKYMEEMEYQEISTIMNIPVGTLKSMVSRAINKIQKA